MFIGLVKKKPIKISSKDITFHEHDNSAAAGLVPQTIL